MKNTVSFETASRLKAAGFPQPEPEAGQVWYEGQKAYVLGKIEQRQLHGVYLDGECFEACDINAMRDDIFAPTATDILAQLPSAANISKPFNAELWLCVYGENEDNWTESNNPAEAAALAWFEIHEKKAFTPNARIRFNREQTIECYDENGKQNLLVIGKGKEYDAILKDMKATIKTVFGPVEFHLSNDDIVFLEWL